MSRLRRRVREDLLNPDAPRQAAPPDPASLALLSALQMLHAHLCWARGSVCWLDFAVRTSAAMARVEAESASPAAPVSPPVHDGCVVIDFPRAGSKRFAHKIR